MLYSLILFWPIDDIIVACILAWGRGMHDASGFVSAISLHHFALLKWSQADLSVFKFSTLD